MGEPEKESNKAEFYGEELIKFLEKNENKVVEYLDNIAQESKVVRSNILKFICHRKPELGQRLIQHLIQKHQEKLEIIYIHDGVDEIFTKNPKLFFDIVEEHIDSPTKWRQKLVTDLLEIISETVLKFDKEIEEKTRKETLLGLNKLFNLLGLKD
nr:hypothetical protein [Candidatus Freyarchaeota archaeon]